MAFPPWRSSNAILARAAFRPWPVSTTPSILLYLAEDLVPLGPFGYHPLVVATRRPTGS
ncbi:MAG TPA: hypothetical protein VLJ14_12010 [Ktedonobacterales bacterium]|nr:hypothetical protein [Ktedonobacterales bacterium]